MAANPSPTKESAQQRNGNASNLMVRSFVENIVQAVSRDILCYAMKTLRHCFIVGHVHDELIIECSPAVDLNVICKQMGRSPDWMPDIQLRADGYETCFYKKD